VGSKVLVDAFRKNQTLIRIPTTLAIGGTLSLSQIYLGFQCKFHNSNSFQTQ